MRLLRNPYSLVAITIAISAAITAATAAALYLSVCCGLWGVCGGLVY